MKANTAAALITVANKYVASVANRIDAALNLKNAILEAWSEARATTKPAAFRDELVATLTDPEKVNAVRIDTGDGKERWVRPITEKYLIEILRKMDPASFRQRGPRPDAGISRNGDKVKYTVEQIQAAATGLGMSGKSIAALLASLANA